MARGIDLSSLASAVAIWCFVTDQYSRGANEAFVRHYAGGGVLLFHDCQMKVDRICGGHPCFSTSQAVQILTAVPNMPEPNNLSIAKLRDCSGVVAQFDADDTHRCRLRCRL